MSKIYAKLIAMALMLVLSLSVVVVASYAWFVLSGNPVVTGIQVTIGGGNTILTAPNITQEVEGTTYCYPGHFSDKLNFGLEPSYAYLQELGSLTPVSTYNGVDWMLPAYYTSADAEVKEGKVPNGQLKDITQFQVDSELMYANLPASEKEKIEEGSYIYLDFWVVSPGGDYKLRVSTGDEDEDGGSFVIDLLQPTVTEEGGYVLNYSAGNASSAVRIGFLANSVRLTDNTMLHYQNSIYYDERFHSLCGLYAEPNSGTYYSEFDHFTIYEPNGDSHPANADLDGAYVPTKALALVDGTIVERPVNDRVTVQLSSVWKAAEKGEGTTAIEQRFQAALLNRNTEGMETAQIAQAFYGTYLQGQLGPYVSKGRFVSGILNAGGPIYQSQLQALTAGATEDVHIIQLEKNVPQRIRMFVWLEGQDMDCSNGRNSTQFAVNIEFAGGTE